MRGYYLVVSIQSVAEVGEPVDLPRTESVSSSRGVACISMHMRRVHEIWGRKSSSDDETDESFAYSRYVVSALELREFGCFLTIWSACSIHASIHASIRGTVNAPSLPRTSWDTRDICRHVEHQKLACGNARSDECHREQCLYEIIQTHKRES